MKHAQDTDGRDRAKQILKDNDYKQDKALADREVRKGISEHEKQLHSGKKSRLKLACGGRADGGRAEGEAPKSRLDRKSRAHGGRNKGKEAKVAVNVINAGSKPSMPMPPMGGAPMPPRPPMAPPQPPPPGAAGAPPMPQRPPMPPQGGMPGGRPFKSGGPVRNKSIGVHLEGGAGGGLGRLEKAKAESKRKKAV